MNTWDEDDIDLHGENAIEVDNATADEYVNLVKTRKVKRKEREVAEDNKEKPELDFIQPRKDRRFKLYLRYEGRKGPPMHLKVRLPKTGAYEDGKSRIIKRMFIAQYNTHRELLSEHSVHLRSDLGVAIPDEDSISGYVGFGGMLFIVDGSSPGKPPENNVYSWGKCAFSNAEGDMPSMMLSLQRKRITKVSVGIEHAIAVTEGGRTYTWGMNDFGQLGTGDEENRLLPTLTEVPYDVFITDAVCGGRFTLGWTKTGDLYSWGRFQASNFPRKFVDTWCNGYEVKGEMGIKGKKVLSVSAGDMHMAVVTKDFQLYTWGYNDYGQLGWGLHGVDRTGQQKPKQVLGVLEDEEIIGAACGGAHTLCWTKSGKAFGWGSNNLGQIGRALRQINPEPDEVPMSCKITRIVAGWQCSIFIDENGNSIVAGGLAAEGPSIEEPKEGVNEQDQEFERKLPPNPTGGNVMDLVGGGSALTEYALSTASIGEAHAIVATKDGKLYGWGYNRQAQAIGRFSDDTFASLEKIIMADVSAKHSRAISVAVGGSQSYGLLCPSS